MPVLRQPGAASATPRSNRAAHVEPACDLAAWAEVAWTLAQLDGLDVLHHAREAVRLLERIEKGERWLRGGAPEVRRSDDPAARIHLLNLRDRLTRELLAVRCYERVCWTRCNETWGFVCNAGPDGFAIQFALFGGLLAADDPPRALWDGLLSGRDPPGRGPGDQWVSGQIRPGAAVWELQSFKELLARKQDKRVVS